MNSNDKARNILFLSYSKADRDICAMVEAAIGMSAKRLGYEVWWDRSLVAGQSWSAELERRLARAGAAIVLVSVDSLNSGFVWDREVRPLLARDVPVAPLLVRHCAWETTEIGELLHDLQFLPPGSTKALMRREDDHEIALAEIARGLGSWLPPLVDEPGPGGGGATERRRPVEDMPAVEKGDLYSVPNLPANYQARDDLFDDFRARLLGDRTGAAAITSAPRIGLFGEGGVGKSVLATALARDEVVRQSFPDGIYWVTVGDEPSRIPVLQEQLARDLGVDVSTAQTTIERRRILADAVQDRRCLIIADDVWSGQDALSFNLSGPGTRVLFTTRVERILELPELRATRLMVPKLTVAEAITFVRFQIGESAELPPAALEVIEQTGRGMFALSIAVGAFKNGLRWNVLHSRFAAATEWYPDELEGNFRAMRVALSALTPRELERYYDLAVFPADESIPVSTIDRFWKHSGERNTRALLERFQTGRLLELDEEFARFHDDQLLYLTARMTDQTARHGELLSAHRPESARWRDLPHSDDYMWRHLVLHVVKAADYAQETLGVDLDWIAQQWCLNGPSAVERDLTSLAEHQEPKHRSQAVLKRVRRLAHLTRDLWDLPSIANTLAVHLSDVRESAGLVRHREQDWLRPAFPVDAPSDALERVLAGHKDGVRAVTAFAGESGWRLASAGVDKQVKIWNFDSPDDEPRVLTGHGGWLNAVHAFRWGGEWHCASGGDDRKVRIWNLADPDGEPVLLRGSNERVTTITSFGQGGDTFLCVGSGGGLARVWRLSDLTSVKVFRGHSGPIYAATAYEDADGKWRVVSGSRDKEVKVWDPLTGAELRSMSYDSGVRSVATFVANGEVHVVCGHLDGAISFRRLSAAEPTVLPTHAGPVKAVAVFEREGAVFVVSASADGSVKVQDVRDRIAAVRTYVGHVGPVNAICTFVDHDTWYLCSASLDGSIRVWNLGMPETDESRRHRHSLKVRAIAECRDKAYPAIMTASDDGIIRLWRRSDPQRSTKIFTSTDAIHAATCWSAGSVEHVAWAGADKQLRTAHLSSDRTLPDPFVLDCGSSGVRGLRCCHAGGRRLLVAACGDRSVRIWDADEPTAPPRVLRGHRSVVNDVGVLPDGDRPLLLSAGDDKTVRLWDPDRPEPLLATYDHPAEVHAVAAFDDGSGRKGISGAEDGEVRLIDVECSSAQAETIGRHSSAVTAVSAVRTPDGTLVACGTADGLVTLWDPRTRRRTAQVRLGQTVTAVASTATEGELVVAYDTSWALLRCEPGANRNGN